MAHGQVLTHGGAPAGLSLGEAFSATAAHEGGLSQETVLLGNWMAQKQGSFVQKSQPVK